MQEFTAKVTWPGGNWVNWDMVQGSNVAAKFQRMSARCASLLSAGTAFFPKSLQWAGSQWWLSFLFRNCSTQGALQIPCQPASQPASQSVSLITWGFHTLPDHNAYLPSTSPQLRCSQLEMTITCSVIVGCVFSNPLGDSLLVGGVEGRRFSHGT